MFLSTLYKHAFQVLAESSNNIGNNEAYLIGPDLKLELVAEGNRRAENLPTVNEVAGIIPNEYGNDGFRDIRIYLRNSSSNKPTTNQVFKLLAKIMLYICQCIMLCYFFMVI
jgi:hypothetical protein